MNAYENKALELANWLETGEIEEIDLQESANMLRQQADENKEINQENNDLRYLIAQQADRIAELEADVDKKITLIKMYEATHEPKKQSEPVAWRSRWKNHKGEFITGWIVSLTNAENPDPRQVIEPLYTTPQTKPLSEPVAWMATSKVIVLEPMEGLIPLYKHLPQTKPLIDDDVEEFEWMLKKYFNYKPDEPAPNLNKIIRAIEAKVRGQ